MIMVTRRSRHTGRPFFTSPVYSSAMADRMAEEVVAGLNRKQYVGSLHHIVPKFILKRFADASEQVFVRDRVTGADGRRNIKNLGVKDFYTFIDRNGELDSSHESILG